MAFRKQYQETGLDTLKTVGGYLGEGTHLVTIQSVTDLQQTLRITYTTQFGDSFTESVFIEGKAGGNYSRTIQDILSTLPLDVLKLVVEEDNYGRLEGMELRVRIARSPGNYIRRTNSGHVIVGDKETSPPYPNYQAAKLALETMGNKSYLRIVEYLPKEAEVKGVW